MPLIPTVTFMEEVACALKARLEEERACREELERALMRVVLRLDTAEAALTYAQRESTEQLETVRVLKRALREGRYGV